MSSSVNERAYSYFIRTSSFVCMLGTLVILLTKRNHKQISMNFTVQFEWKTEINKKTEKKLAVCACFILLLKK